MELAHRRRTPVPCGMRRGGDGQETRQFHRRQRVEVRPRAAVVAGPGQIERPPARRSSRRERFVGPPSPARPQAPSLAREPGRHPRHVPPNTLGRPPGPDPRIGKHSRHLKSSMPRSVPGCASPATLHISPFSCLPSPPFGPRAPPCRTRKKRTSLPAHRARPGRRPSCGERCRGGPRRRRVDIIADGGPLRRAVGLPAARRRRALEYRAAQPMAVVLSRRRVPLSASLRGADTAALLRDDRCAIRRPRPRRAPSPRWSDCRPENDGARRRRLRHHERAQDTGVVTGTLLATVDEPR